MKKGRRILTTIGNACEIAQKVMAENNVVYHEYDEADRARIRAIYDTLHEVYPMSFERFEHIFAKNLDKYREVIIFEWIAKRYRTLAADPSTPMAEKQRTFNHLLVESMRKWPVQLVNEQNQVVTTITPL